MIVRLNVSHHHQHTGLDIVFFDAHVEQPFPPIFYLSYVKRCAHTGDKPSRNLCVTVSQTQTEVRRTRGFLYLFDGDLFPETRAQREREREERDKAIASPWNSFLVPLVRDRNEKFPRLYQLLMRLKRQQFYCFSSFFTISPRATYLVVCLSRKRIKSVFNACRNIFDATLLFHNEEEEEKIVPDSRQHLTVIDLTKTEEEEEKEEECSATPDLEFSTRYF